MDYIQVTLSIRGSTCSGESIAVVGSCERLGSWCAQRAVILHPEDDGTLWKQTIDIPRGVVANYRYFKGYFLESKGIYYILQLNSMVLIGHCFWWWCWAHYWGSASNWLMSSTRDFLKLLARVNGVILGDALSAVIVLRLGTVTLWSVWQFVNMYEEMRKK